MKLKADGIVRKYTVGRQRDGGSFRPIGPQRIQKTPDSCHAGCRHSGRRWPEAAEAASPPGQPAAEAKNIKCLRRHALKLYAFIVITVSVLTGYCASGLCEQDEKGAMELRIVWQRLVDADGQTCDRCGSTEKELQQGIASLKDALDPLGIKVTLEKKSLGLECAKNIIESNQILISGHPLEEWLGAKVGTSACGSCCEKLGETVECRTTTVDGKTYEIIPAKLIVKAGLKAAAGLLTAPSTESCCPKDKGSTEKNEKCCPKKE